MVDHLQFTLVKLASSITVKRFHTNGMFAYGCEYAQHKAKQD